MVSRLLWAQELSGFDSPLPDYGRALCTSMPENNEREDAEKVSFGSTTETASSLLSDTAMPISDTGSGGEDARVKLWTALFLGTNREEPMILTWQDTDEVTRFLGYVATVFGEAVRKECEFRIEKLPPTEPIDLERILYAAKEEHDAHLVEAIVKFNSTPFDSRLDLK